MKTSFFKLCFLIILINFSFSCKKDNSSGTFSNAGITGTWNSYEYIRSSVTTAPPCNCLTPNYQDGITFREDMTYISRHYVDGSWSESSEYTGRYEMGPSKILLYAKDPATHEEIKPATEWAIKKRTQTELWIKIPNTDLEAHLKKVDAVNQ